jgi:hypothetical protein
MTSNETELKFSQQHSLDLMEAQLQHQNSSFDALDQKAQQVINISGVIVALVAGFAAIQNSPSNILKALVIFLLILCAGAIGLALRVLWLKHWDNVISIESEEDQKKLLSQPYPEKVYWEQMMQNYIETVVSRKKVLDEKTYYTQAALKVTIVELLITAIILINQIFFSPTLKP